MQWLLTTKTRKNTKLLTIFEARTRIPLWLSSLFYESYNYISQIIERLDNLRFTWILFKIVDVMWMEECVGLECILSCATTGTTNMKVENQFIYIWTQNATVTNQNEKQNTQYMYKLIQYTVLLYSWMASIRNVICSNKWHNHCSNCQYFAIHVDIQRN